MAITRSMSNSSNATHGGSVAAATTEPPQAGPSRTRSTSTASSRDSANKRKGTKRGNASGPKELGGKKASKKESARLPSIVETETTQTRESIVSVTVERISATMTSRVQTDSSSLLPPPEGARQPRWPRTIKSTPAPVQPLETNEEKGKAVEKPPATPNAETTARPPKRHRDESDGGDVQAGTSQQGSRRTRRKIEEPVIAAASSSELPRLSLREKGLQIRAAREKAAREKEAAALAAAEAQERVRASPIRPTVRAPMLSNGIDTTTTTTTVASDGEETRMRKDKGKGKMVDSPPTETSQQAASSTLHKIEEPAIVAAPSSEPPRLSLREKGIQIRAAREKAAREKEAAALEAAEAQERARVSPIRPTLAAFGLTNGVAPTSTISNHGEEENRPRKDKGKGRMVDPPPAETSQQAAVHTRRERHDALEAAKAEVRARVSAVPVSGFANSVGITSTTINNNGVEENGVKKDKGKGKMVDSPPAPPTEAPRVGSKRTRIEDADDEDTPYPSTEPGPSRPAKRQTTTKLSSEPVATEYDLSAFGGDTGRAARTARRFPSVPARSLALRPIYDYRFPDAPIRIHNPPSAESSRMAQLRDEAKGTAGGHKEQSTPGSGSEAVLDPPLWVPQENPFGRPRTPEEADLEDPEWRKLRWYELPKPSLPKASAVTPTKSSPVPSTPKAPSVEKSMPTREIPLTNAALARLMFASSSPGAGPSRLARSPTPPSSSSSSPSPDAFKHVSMGLHGGGEVEATEAPEPGPESTPTHSAPPDAQVVEDEPEGQEERLLSPPPEVLGHIYHSEAEVPPEYRGAFQYVIWRLEDTAAQSLEMGIPEATLLYCIGNVDSEAEDTEDTKD